MSWILEHWSEVLQIIGSFVAAATIITGLTPTPKDDEWLKKIVSALSFVTSKDKEGTFKVPFK